MILSQSTGQEKQTELMDYREVPEVDPEDEVPDAPLCCVLKTERGERPAEAERGEDPTISTYSVSLARTQREDPELDPIRLALEANGKDLIKYLEMGYYIAPENSSEL